MVLRLKMFRNYFYLNGLLSFCNLNIYGTLINMHSLLSKLTVYIQVYVNFRKGTSYFDIEVK